MTLIQLIRNKLGPIIVILIGLSLGLFVLQTALNSNSGLLGGKGNTVGVIDGEKISVNDYQAKVEKTTESYKLNTNQQNIDDNLVYSLRDQTWNQMINDYLNQREYDALGLTLPDKQLQDLFYGADPYPELKKSFTNPQTGVFDPMAVKNYMDNIDKKDQSGVDPAEKRLRWNNFVEYVQNDVIATKYKTLLKKAIYVPKWEAEMAYQEKETKYTVDYVKIPFSDVSDSSVKVTDADLQNYINNHKTELNQEDETRKVEYVIFTVKPSHDDTVKASDYVNDAYNHFVSAPGDTNYYRVKGDRGYDKMYFGGYMIKSSKLKDTLMKIPVGGIVPTFFEDGDFKTAVLVDRLMMPDSVKASHILFSTQNGADSVKVKAKADSVFTVLKAGASTFEEMASKYSDDKTSGQKGGDLGYIKYGMTVPQFNDYLFKTGKAGELSMVKTQFGYHIIRITESPAATPQVKYISVTRKVESSSTTENNYYEMASKFLSANSTPETFTKSAQGIQYNHQTADQLKKNDFQIPGLSSARDVVKWAFNSDKDAISPVFTVQDNYIVAHLVMITPAGTPTVEAVRQQIEPLVRNELKGSMIAAQVNASGALNSTLESVAQKFNKTVSTAENVSFADGYMNNIGFEPKVNGALASLQEGKISKTIVGRNAVFVLLLKQVTKPAAVADYNQYRSEIESSSSPKMEYGFAEALKKTITIKDERYLFF